MKIAVLGIDLFGNQVDEIVIFNNLTGEIKDRLSSIAIFPAKHFVTDKETTSRVVDEIRLELEERISILKKTINCLKRKESSKELILT